MANTLKHRKCAFCRGSVPENYDACPYCDEQFEPRTPVHRFVDALLPEEQPITRVLIGLAVAVFALMGLVAGGTSLVSPSVYTLIHFGAMFPPYMVEGQWWRLVTPLFLHGDLVHIGFNLYVLWGVGPLIENSFGRSRYLLAFFVCGVASMMCSFAWSGLALDVAQVISIPKLFTPETVAAFTTPSVGMSGALTGLIGIGIAAGHKVNNEQGLAIRNRFLSFMGFILLFGLLMPGVDNAGHLGGFFAGLGMGSLMPLRDRAKRLWGWVYAVLGVVAAVGLVGSLVLHGLSMPLQYPADDAYYPTGIFGQGLRESSPDDSLMVQSSKACSEALTELESKSTEKPNQDTLKRALLNCREHRYLSPMDAKAYYRLASALVLSGDSKGACHELEMGWKVDYPRQARLNYRLEKLRESSKDQQFAIEVMLAREEQLQNETKAMHERLGCSAELP